jgi:uncharacterized protein
MTRDEFLEAIDRGDEEAVRDGLLDDPSLAASRDRDGVSATMHALYRGRATIAAQVAQALPELDVFEAAALGRVDRLRELLRGDATLARARTGDGFTALHYPAFFGEGDAAGATSALLDAGSDVNARSANDFAVLPLHSAVAGNHADVAALLIDAGADVNARQRHGWTPLHGAAHTGALETVERLLAAGADPSAMNDDGVTSADLAAEAGHDAVMARLRGDAQ